MPTWNKLCIRVQRGPSPRIAPVFALMLWADLLLFAADETPYFIALNPATFQIAKGSILIIGTDCADLTEQFYNRVFCRISQPASGAYGIPLNQMVDNLGTPSDI
jgi:hypothetical protein